MKPTVTRAMNPAKHWVIRPAGFSLVEVMVALVIGMLGIVVMMQVFTVNEAQKRTTTSGDDAISSGAVSLYGIQRDIEQSGWGISGISMIGCSATGIWRPLPAPQVNVTIPLAPVTINSTLIPAGFADPGTETLLVVSGSSNGAATGDVIQTGSGTTLLTVATPTAFVQGDRVIGVPRDRGAACAASALLQVNATPANPFESLSVSGPLTGELIFNLGAAPRAIGYAVAGGNLMSCNFTALDCSNTGNWDNIASNVVSLRAQYGHDDTPMSGIVRTWDRVTPVAPAPVGCGFVRIPAVRLAIVARSSQPERVDGAGNSVTPVPPPWMGCLDAANDLITPCESAAVGFTFLDPDLVWPRWQDFRYKVFQTVVPLRNVTSMGAVDGC